MIEEIALRVEPRIAADMNTLIAQAAIKSRIDRKRIKGAKIVKRSIDARQRKVMVNIILRIYIDEMPSNTSLGIKPTYRDVDDAQQVIVVGAGPAGLFAALRLIELGLKPVVLERGKDVDERRKDMAKIARENIVNPDSNYCFGEGGAGAYSDGKLYTRSKKRGSVDKILSVFHSHGASEDILVDAHPHIGTDKLPDVIKAMRMTIIRHGGEVHFNTRVTGLAVGVRLEHPQQLIDSIQYHNPHGRGKYLPAAEYSMLTRVDNRGVYSFCMCPGGFIIPAASSPGQLVVNGMSPSSRGTRWANSGMVVEILPEDIDNGKADDPLKMMKYQEDIETRFFEDAGKTQNAPAQRMIDFTQGKPSRDLPTTSYAPGIHTARIDLLLPNPVASRLQKGFIDFGRKANGFLTNDAVLIGCETRTSSPVRISRNPENLRHIRLNGLFPCGEGAGYAGGIVSAAIDGERCADAVYQSLQ